MNNSIANMPFLKKLSHSVKSSFIYLGVFILWCLAHLPLSWLIKIGYGLGWLLYKLVKRRTSITRKNIELSFPDLNPEQREALTLKCIQENTCGLFESAKGWWGNMQPILDQTEVHGIDIIQKAAAEGRGVLLIGAHFTTLDMGGRIISELWPINILYRPFNNPIFDRFILKARRSFYKDVIDKSRMRDLVRSLQKGGTLWYPADQDYGPKDSVFAPFFNIQAATLATTAGLAKMARGHVVGLYHHRMPDNHYRIEFVEMPDFPTEDPQAAATQANAMLEKGISLYPAQYMWVHRRYKTRPEGEEKIY